MSTLPVGIELTRIAWQSELVSESINGFMINLAEAVAIVLAVLVIPSGLRMGIIIGTALVLTILATFIPMAMMGIDLQRMSLGALVIALGQPRPEPRRPSSELPGDAELLAAQERENAALEAERQRRAREAAREAAEAVLRQASAGEVDLVELVGSTPGWLRYRLPRRYQRHNSKPLCIGQKQVWFLLRFLGDDSAFRLDHCRQPEFSSYRWVDFWYPVDNVITFKRRVYRKALSLLEPMAESHLSPD